MEHVSYELKKVPKEEKHLINMVCDTLEGLSIISDRIVDFRFFRQISQLQTCNIFQFMSYHRACSLCMKKYPNHGEDQINMMIVPLEVLWMISTGFVDFRFFVKFHRSGHATFVSF